MAVRMRWRKEDHIAFLERRMKTLHFRRMKSRQVDQSDAPPDEYY